MELPGHGIIEGRDWDLRGGVDEYLSKLDFAGQRVLEIGPASGFLTFEMEKRGANVVSVEVTAEHGWRSEEHTSELQSLTNLVCRLLLEKKKKKTQNKIIKNKN